ncbi:hypothetical protein UACE39S_03227 [Ureibacillus acetophenoni]
MKNNTRVFLSSLLSFLLIFSVFSVTASAASNNLADEPNLEIELQVEVERAKNNNLPHESSLESEAYEIQAMRILVYFAQEAVGDVIDGTVQYFTGAPPAQWVTWGLERIERDIKSVYWQFRNNNTIPWRGIEVSRDGSVYGCVTFPCMVESFVEEEEK